MSTEIDKSSTDVAHRHEQPSDWGWHAEFPRLATFAGIVSGLSLILMVTSTHYNHSGTFWLLLFAALIFVGLFVAHHFRKNAYRSRPKK